MGMVGRDQVLELVVQRSIFPDCLGLNHTRLIPVIQPWCDVIEATLSTLMLLDDALSF